MKKLRRVFGSVANLNSDRDDLSSTELPPIPLNTSRKSISGSIHGLGDHRGSYVSYESQSLDSFNSTVSAEIDPYSKNDKNFTKLHKWAYIGDVTKLKKFIRKVPVDSKDGDGKTALHHAAAQGRGDALLFLLGSKGNVEIKDNNGMTPFLRAVERSQLPVVQMLLQRRVDVHVTDNQGNGSCHFAGRTGAVDLLTLLLDCGGDSDALNCLGRTPLHLACSENQEEVVETLLRHGTSVNVRDKEGVTPLMMAAKVGSAPLVETLLENGADVSNIDASKWSAADYARFTNHNQLYYHLSGLMEKSKSCGLFSKDLLNVSDEGNIQEEENILASNKEGKASDNEGAADSWSDTSNMESIKEKPKLNLTKFLPSSDESADNANANVSDLALAAVGPPKPPRLYTSSSSLASVDMDGNDEDGEQTNKNPLVVDEKELRIDDSWKSSSDEEPPLKPLSLFPNDASNISERNHDDVTGISHPSRVKKEDLQAELGLGDIDYHSSEEVSFDDDYAVLPIEESLRSFSGNQKSSSAFVHSSHDKDSLPSKSPALESLGIVVPMDSPRSSSQSKTPRKVGGTSENFLSSSEEDVKKMSHSHRKSPQKSPKKVKAERMKSSTDGSDTDEEASLHQFRRKNSTPTHMLTGGELTIEENEEEAMAVESSTQKLSFSKYCSYGDLFLSNLKEENGKNDMKTIIRSNQTRSGASTVSSVVGTLGREGTMQEVEELWEANPIITPKDSYSECNTENADEDSKSTEKEIFPLPGGMAVEELTPLSVNLDNVNDHDLEKSPMDKSNSVGDNENLGNDISSAIVERDSVDAVGLSTSKASSPGCRKSPVVTGKKIMGRLSFPKEEMSAENVENQVFSIENVEGTKKEEYKTYVGKSDSDKLKSHSVISISPSRRGSRSGTGRTSGFGSIVFSDEESISQDLLTTPRFMEEIDDVISAASTETEESTHINSGLKDSLLTPLSSLPDAADITQLQDLVRELRLKLEKEYGRRAAIETRYSHLQVQENQTRLENSHLEQDSQRMEQEISSLTARIKQLEYLGKCEQDSSRLKDQSLEEFHLRCVELEEQCGTLCTNALRQEQVVESLMVQLQTKERVNQSLQSRLEDISSQTKYVSMKSCQTDKVLVDDQDNCNLISSVEASVQTLDNNYGNTINFALMSGEDDDLEIIKEGICLICQKKKELGVLETIDISVQTETEIGYNADQSTFICVGTQTLLPCISVYSTGVQCIPEKVMKFCQTYNSTQSRHSQTDMTNDNCEVTFKKSFSESGCQTFFPGKVASIQTENGKLSTSEQQIDLKGCQTFTASEVASTLEPILHNCFQDFKLVVFEEIEGNQNSLKEMMAKSVASQINDLKSKMETLLLQKSVEQTHESELKFKELSLDVKEILQGHGNIIAEYCTATTSGDSSNIYDVLTHTNNNLESTFQDIRYVVGEIKQSQDSSEEKRASNMENIMKDNVESNERIMKNLADFQRENMNANNEISAKFNQLMANLSSIDKSMSNLINLEDRSYSEESIQEIINQLSMVEKSILLSVEKNNASQDFLSLESELCKINDSIHKKLSALQHSMQAITSGDRVDEDVIEFCLEKLSENNKQLLTVFRAKSSESTTNINEVVEENFHIVQEHLRKVQMSLAQRLNELSQDFSQTGDQMSCTGKQIDDMASQVSGIQNTLLHIQSSLEALQSLPASAGIDKTLFECLRAGNEQMTSSLTLQYESIVQLLESLQNEVHNTAVKTHGLEDKTEIRQLKEKLFKKDDEISELHCSQELLRKKLHSQVTNYEHSQLKEEELQKKTEILQRKLHQTEHNLREKEEELKQEKLKATSYNDDLVKLQQENLKLSTENNNFIARFNSEQHQKILYEKELQHYQDAKEAAETRVQDLMIQINQQQLQIQRSPPSGREKDEDIILTKQKEILDLETEKKKLEAHQNEQCTKLCQLESQLKDTKANLALEQSNRDELEKQLKKTKCTVERLQKALSEATIEQGVLQDLKDNNKELQETLNSNEMAMDALRKRLDSVNKEKLHLKQDVMHMKEEKLSFDIIKHEKEIAEDMQKKMEAQLQMLQKRISNDFIPKIGLSHLKNELEQKYQLELSTKISELNHVLKEQSSLQESHARVKNSEEQGLKGEISRLSDEVVRLKALLSIHEEEKDSWKVRHERLMNLYQQQLQPPHYLQNLHRKKCEDSLSVNLREINTHLQTPLASSTFLGRLTPPSSLNLSKVPCNIDSYHYTHSDTMDRMIQKRLKLAENDPSRFLSTSDDKPHARITPMQPSQPLQDSMPTLDKSCEAYVDLLNKKYCL